jgi:hypothetical protein
MMAGVYGFPVNAAVNGLWFHKDLIENAGVTMPAGAWTWNDAIPILQKLTQRSADGRVTRYGLVFDWDNNYLQFIYQWGGRMYTPDGTRPRLDSPEAIAAVQFMQDLIFKHHVAPGAAEEAAISAAGGYGGGTVITLFGAQRGRRARWAGDGGSHACAKMSLRRCVSGVAEARRTARFTPSSATARRRSSTEQPARGQQALKFLEYLHSADYQTA